MKLQQIKTLTEAKAAMERLTWEVVQEERALDASISEFWTIYEGKMKA
jgi:hypothetical protein